MSYAQSVTNIINTRSGCRREKHQTEKQAQFRDIRRSRVGKAWVAKRREKHLKTYIWHPPDLKTTKQGQIWKEKVKASWVKSTVAGSKISHAAGGGRACESDAQMNWRHVEVVGCLRRFRWRGRRAMMLAGKWSGTYQMWTQHKAWYELSEWNTTGGKAGKTVGMNMTRGRNGNWNETGFLTLVDSGSTGNDDGLGLPLTSLWYHLKLGETERQLRLNPLSKLHSGGHYICIKA